MKISAKVKTRTSKNELMKNPDGTYTVFLAASPVKGEANNSLIKLLSREFGIVKSHIRILKGRHSRNKLISIGEE